MRNKEAAAGDFSEVALRPSDFAHRTTVNSICHVCGGMLWGVNAKPVSNIPVKMKKTAWYKIIHYKNYAKKTLTSSYVLRGHEKEYLEEKGVEEFKECSYEYGPRRIALSRYIKKYLNGFSKCSFSPIFQMNKLKYCYANLRQELNRIMSKNSIM